jgi:hypothetical protein
MAQTMEDDRARAVLVQMAQAWLRLAEGRDGKDKY